MSAPAMNVRQCSAALPALNSVSDIRLYISRRSRVFTLSQWQAAMSVSSSTIRWAWVAG